MGNIILTYQSGCIKAKLDNSYKTLVDNVSFNVEVNKTLALIGETGSGKTMIALSIMNLLPSNVKQEQASIIFDNKDIFHYKKMKQLLGNQIVYIPQNGYEFLNPTRKIKDQLFDNLKKIKVSKEQLLNKSIDVLMKAGFDNPIEILNKYPFELSGGMAQRVTIALSLCANAKLIICDEPTNGLNYEEKFEFINSLKSLFKDAGILIITHDISLAKLTDESLIICKGKAMEKGPSNEILTNPKNEYSKALLNALVSNGMKTSNVIRNQEGNCPFYNRCLKANEQCLKEKVNDFWWCNDD